MFIEILIDTAITAIVYIIIYQLIFPVATRKEFEEYKRFVEEKFKKRSDYLNEKIATFDSLAKELGYEYLCEVVKEQGCHKEGCWCGGSFGKSVLRYSWKKIDNARFVHPTGMEIVKGELKVMKKNKKYRLPE